jgi:hypothetical protein
MRLDRANSAVIPPIFLCDGFRSSGQLDGEVEHGALTRRDVGLAMIDRDLVGDPGVLRVDAQNGAVGDDAVLAVVHPAGGYHDHLLLGFG